MLDGPHQKPETLVSMTWPQYVRGECKVTFFVPKYEIVRLTRYEAELLSVMLMRNPRPTTRTEAIDILWGNPNSEPKYPEDRVSQLIGFLKHKTKGAITMTSAGYRVRT